MVKVCLCGQAQDDQAQMQWGLAYLEHDWALYKTCMCKIRENESLKLYYMQKNNVLRIVLNLNVKTKAVFAKHIALLRKILLKIINTNIYICIQMKS